MKDLPTKEQLELIQNANIDTFRHCVYVLFLCIYVALIIVLVLIGLQYDFSFVEGLGIGAILGIMGKMLSDGWQFFFRTSGHKK